MDKYKAEMIVKTHLGFNGTADQIVRGCNKQGGFKICLSTRLKNPWGGFIRDDKQVFWKKLWSLKLPGTINILAGSAL